MYKLLVVTLGLIALFALGVKAQNGEEEAKTKCRDYLLQMTYSNISVHNSDWADFTLELVENDEGEKKLDSKLKIKKEIPDDALVDLIVYVEKNDGKWDIEKIDLNRQVCDFMNTYTTFVRDVALSGTFPTGCPINIDEYFLKQYTVDSCLFAPSMLRTNFRLTFALKESMDEDPILELFIAVSIVDNFD